ncbi:MAG: peptidyl-prolyl cis-trans isomerase [Pseudomonadota bacterium]
MAKDGAKKGSTIGKTAMWILLGLLAFSLLGFGATGLSGNIRTIGSVGSKSIPVDDYARGLQNEIQALSQQTGQPISFAQAQQFGIDRAVLQSLVRNRALDHETSELGLSVGDGTVRDEILQISAFQGVDGAFDREGYRFTLERSGISEGEFEDSLREEAARRVLQGAILGGVDMPAIYAQTLISYVGEQRSFSWSQLDATALDADLPAPTAEELRAYYAENTDAFMLPETKMITYVVLSPDALTDEVEVPEDELRAEYDARLSQYVQPERRLVERLVFSDEEAANQAAAALDVGGTTFRALVEDRGLTLTDVDLGDVSEADLASAGAAVFAAGTGDVVGPLPSSLGPALFRVNAILPAQNIPFEEAEADLRAELAIARAIRAVEARALDLDDQLAGGATLEQLAEETEMTLETIGWHAGLNEGVAAYPDFRRAARDLALDDFPQIDQLEDGSIFAMRLDEELPVRPNPYQDAIAEVRAAWDAAQTVAALSTRAAEVVTELEAGGSLETAGLTAFSETNLTRSASVAGVPDDFMSTVFDMAEGEIRVIEGQQSVVIVTLETIAPASETPEREAMRTQLRAQLGQALARDLFNIYADDVVRRAGPEIDQRALQAVHVNFP